MSEKISDYVGIVGGVFGDTDLFDISEDIGSGLYQTRSITGAEIKASITGGSPLSDSDQVLSSSSRKVTLNGSTVTDVLDTQTAGGASVLIQRGDLSVVLPTGYLGVNTTSIGPGFGGHKLTIVNPTGSHGVYVQQSGANGEAFQALLSATSASVHGLNVLSSNSAAVGKYGATFNITGSTIGLNIALNILNGDIKLGTGTGTKFGQGPTEKFSFWGATPIVQPVHNPDVIGTAVGTDAAIINDLVTVINLINANDAATGLTASS